MPFLAPALPLPLTESCIPSATPAGILSSMISSLFTMPLPWHSGHLFFIILPSPPQLGQVVTVCI